MKRCSRNYGGNTSRDIIAEGSLEARCFEVSTKRKVVFAEDARKLAGRRVVISEEINKE